MKFSNCIIEAIKAWKRHSWRGTVVIRISRCKTMIHMYYQSSDGVIENFLPLPTVRRKRFAPPLFHGVSVNHDVAWHCHDRLEELGYDSKLLRSMTDEEVILFHKMEMLDREKK